MYDVYVNASCECVCVRERETDGVCARGVTGADPACVGGRARNLSRCRFVGLFFFFRGSRFRAKIDPVIHPPPPPPPMLRWRVALLGFCLSF